MTISYISYKKKERDKQEREIEKSIQKKTEDYERSRDEKYKFEIDILQSKLQSIREIKIRGMENRGGKVFKIFFVIWRKVIMQKRLFQN